MIDGATQERLEHCVRRESRSLFQYVREVPVWAAADDKDDLGQLRRMADAELTAAETLAKWLQKRRQGQLYLGPFPGEFTNFNDAAYSFVLPLIVREHANLLAALQKDATAVGDPDARGLVETLLELKRRHEPQLAALTAKPHTVFN